MHYLWLPIGIAPSILCGWLLLRLLEGNTPVLFKSERWIAGFVLGGILTTFCIFLTEILHLGSFSFLSMFIVQLALVLLLSGIYFKRNPTDSTNLVFAASPSWLLWQKIVAGMLSVWFVLKIIAGYILLIGPAYFDDVLSNWNMRGKVFFYAKHLLLEFEPGKGTGISSYPLSVPLLKTWLAHINGGWHEGLVNSIHMLWYLAAIALVFFALRRLVNVQWAALGAYILGSVPLFTMHGSTPYADCFLSVVIFLAVSWLFFAARTQGDERMSYIRIGAVANALMIWTKNEALLLHLPPIVFLLILVLIIAKFSSAQKRSALLWYIGSILCIAGPWIAFKWVHHLGFGNAKNVSAMTLEWHEGVLNAIGMNTLFEGNWSLLPIVFLGLCIFSWRTVLKTPLCILVGFIAIVWVGQLPIYLLTAVYIEALNQTGYARGIVHLVPLVVVVVTILMREVFERD